MLYHDMCCFAFLLCCCFVALPLFPASLEVIVHDNFGMYSFIEVIEYPY